MKKITLTALSTVVCSLSIAANLAAPGFAQQQPTKTPTTKTAPATTPGGVNSQSQAVEQLKLTKDQQTKLLELQQSVMQKKIAVLTPAQKEQLKLAVKQGKPPSLSLTPAQQTQLQAIQTAAIAQQDAILTPEQKAKLVEMNKQTTPQR
jgi:Spy/CpxP family protein refolding chaperone